MDTPILKKANSYILPTSSPLNGNLIKNHDYKYYHEQSTHQSSRNESEVAKLEETNYSLKQELNKLRQQLNQEKNARESVENILNDLKQNHASLQTEFQNMKENRDMMRDLGKDLEKENVLLNNKLENVQSANNDLSIALNDSKVREESLQDELNSSKLSIQSNSVSAEKEKNLIKAIGTIKYIRKESYEMAKKLKKLKPQWRPNTQNDKIFFKEVLGELWNRLEQLNAEKERRDQESLMFMANKNFIQNQISMSGNQPGSKQVVKQSLENKKNFESAMHILDDIVTNIEEANSNFDDSVIDDKSKLVDQARVFDNLILFFNRIEYIKDAETYKHLMKIYFS